MNTFYNLYTFFFQMAKVSKMFSIEKERKKSNPMAQIEQTIKN